MSKKWATEEEMFLADNFATMDDALLVKKLGVTKEELAKKAKAMELVKEDGAIQKLTGSQDEDSMLTEEGFVEEDEIMTEISEDAPPDVPTTTAPLHYDCRDTYVPGDKIVHTKWNDVGLVEELGVLGGGTRTIVVSFEKRGRQTLAMGCLLDKP